MTERGRGAYLPRIEWEGLRGKWSIEDVQDSPALPDGSEIIELWRDDRYKIRAKITGTPTGSTDDPLPDHGEPGTIIPRHKVEGSGSYGGFVYELSSCIVTRASTSAVVGEPLRFEADLNTYRVRRTVHDETTEPGWLNEWYLNAHRGSPLIYPRHVEREFKEEYRKARNFLGEDITLEGYRSKSGGTCALVETPEVSFIVQPVPKGLGPPWSECLGIEYRSDFGNIPDPDIRDAVAEVVGFVMGRQLVGIGYTAFDQRGATTEEVAISPLEGDLVTMCQRSDEPPVELDQGRPTGVFETLLRELVPRYLKLRDELPLGAALWGYWFSGRLPLGANLPELATSVEMLKNAWFRATDSRSRGVYMPKGDFHELLEEEFTTAQAKLDEVEYGDRILRRMRSAYNMGVNESFDFFFEEIGLPVGKVERRAVRARNRMAHGSAELLDEAAHQEMLDNTLAYRTLFNRIMLKLLGHEGDYVDRSVTGWPDRPLDEPIGGRS